MNGGRNEVVKSLLRWLDILHYTELYWVHGVTVVEE